MAAPNWTYFIRLAGSVFDGTELLIFKGRKSESSSPWKGSEEVRELGLQFVSEVRVYRCR